MADYVSVNKYNNTIIIGFNNEDEKPFAIGEKMNELNDLAYMNGYNWDALFNFYSKRQINLSFTIKNDLKCLAHSAQYRQIVNDNYHCRLLYLAKNAPELPEGFVPGPPLRGHCP